MRKLRAFTLIELLLVVGIIALLISITMPSMVAVRRLSKKTRCLTNLREIGHAMHMYLQVHHDTFPYMARLPSFELANPPDDRLPPMPVALRSEIGGDSELFECPADENTMTPQIPTRKYYNHEKTSYEWESALNGARIGFKKIRLFSGLIHPCLKDVAMVFDFEAFHGGPAVRGSHNVLYADMHVQSDNWEPKTPGLPGP